MHHYTLTNRKLQQSPKCQKHNWSRKASRVLVYGAENRILHSAALDKVPLESGCRFRNSLLRQTEHPERASWHVSAQNNKGKFVRKSELCSVSWISSSMLEQHVVQFRLFKSDRFFWWMCVSRLNLCKRSEQSFRGKETRKKFNIMNYTAKILQYGVMFTP